ncbi:MAG: hypothetical protein ACR2HQ_09225 [Ilumatobacteraceae bacterium]
MVLWFVGAAIAIVRFVFQDPRFDYRLLIVGAVLPLGDGLFGGARILHTLLFSLVVLAVVMLATSRRGRVRPLLLGLPIGTLLHLVVDGAWTDTRLFWWPAGGFDLAGTPLPETSRGWWSVVLEVAGLAILVWVWRASGLSRPAARHRFWRRGRLFGGR